MKRELYEEDHEAFRGTVAAFLEREMVPYLDEWEAAKNTGREVWRKAAEAGVIGFSHPEEYGGAGVTDFRFDMVRSEEVAKHGCGSAAGGWGVSDGIVPGYLLNFGTEEQKQKYVPGLVAGDLIGAIAMTEPGAGSDLQGIKTRAVSAADGSGDWIINGSKTFITNGQNADFVIVVARTDPDAKPSRGTSLLIVDADTPGFERGRNLDKVGLAAQDTSELFFNDVRVPADAVVGEVNMGFKYLMHNLPYERLIIAAGAVAGSRVALEHTADYVFNREAFGGTIGDFQNTQFVLAELETRVDVAEAYLDRCALALNAGELTATEAAKAKWLTSELQVELTTRCLQLFGGYGFMNEYPIAKAFKDSRIQTIYGGTTEVMKYIIGKEMQAKYAGKK